MKRLYYDSRIKKYNYKYTLHDGLSANETIYMSKNGGAVIGIDYSLYGQYVSMGYTAVPWTKNPNTSPNQPPVIAPVIGSIPGTQTQTTTDYLPWIIGAAILIAVI